MTRAGEAEAVEAAVASFDRPGRRQITLGRVYEDDIAEAIAAAYPIIAAATNAALHESRDVTAERAATDEQIAERDTTTIYHIDGTGDDAWLVAEVGRCTCAVGPNGYYGQHERGCGEEGIAKIYELRDAMQAAERAAGDRRALDAVKAIHRPRTATVYSSAHHDADHETEDDRCTDACFEPWELCDGCGSHWPCSTAAALAAAQPTEQKEP